MIDLEFMYCMGGDDLVVDAARVSFSKQADNYGPQQKNERLIQFLAREQHFHLSTEMYFPMFCAHLCGPTRQHRQGTWNEVSRRYIKSNQYGKPDFRAKAEYVKKSLEAHRRSDEFVEEYHHICIDAIATYNKMVAFGFALSKQSNLTKRNYRVVWTGSLCFGRVYSLRSAPETQLETRAFADLIDENERFIPDSMEGSNRWNLMKMNLKTPVCLPLRTLWEGLRNWRQNAERNFPEYGSRCCFGVPTADYRTA